MPSPAAKPGRKDVDMTSQEIKAKIKEYFEENPDVFSDAIEELDSYNGCLGDDRIEPMDMLDEIYCETEPSEVLRRAFYGYDAETWSLDSDGDKRYGAFNPNREYFYFNGYGNLVSTDTRDYSDRLDDNIIEEFYERRPDIWTIDGGNSEITELYGQYGEALEIERDIERFGKEEEDD